MLRRVIAGLVVVGLAIGVWLIWPGSDAPGPTSTTAAAAGSTSSTTAPTAAPSAPPPVTPDASTTTTVEGHGVDTVEEAEVILRELWFGWFEGIYNQDEDRIREVVATEEYLEAGTTAFETLEFTEGPARDQIVFMGVEILRTDAECLALWSESNASFLTEGPNRTGVDIMRWVAGKWLLASSWVDRNDLWEADCEALLRPLQ